jgi:signal transduction histidine kinase
MPDVLVIDDHIDSGKARRDDYSKHHRRAERGLRTSTTSPSSTSRSISRSEKPSEAIRRRLINAVKLFLAILGHNLPNPLNSIMMSAETTLLLNQTATANRQPWTGALYRARSSPRMAAPLK